MAPAGPRRGLQQRRGSSAAAADRSRRRRRAASRLPDRCPSNPAMRSSTAGGAAGSAEGTRAARRCAGSQGCSRQPAVQRTGGRARAALIPPALSLQLRTLVVEQAVKERAPQLALPLALEGQAGPQAHLACRWKAEPVLVRCVGRQRSAVLPSTAALQGMHQPHPAAPPCAHRCPRPARAPPPGSAPAAPRAQWRPRRTHRPATARACPRAAARTGRRRCQSRPGVRVVEWVGGDVAGAGARRPAALWRSRACTRH